MGIVLHTQLIYGQNTRCKTVLYCDFLRKPPVFQEKIVFLPWNIVAINGGIILQCCC